MTTPEGGEMGQSAEVTKNEEQIKEDLEYLKYWKDNFAHLEEVWPSLDKKTQDDLRDLQGLMDQFSNEYGYYLNQRKEDGTLPEVLQDKGSK